MFHWNEFARAHQGKFPLPPLGEVPYEKGGDACWKIWKAPKGDRRGRGLKVERLICSSVSCEKVAWAIHCTHWSEGLATTLSYVLCFLVYLSLLHIRERRNNDTTCKYGLLSHSACLTDDTSSIRWLLDFDRRTFCWHTRWRGLYFGPNSAYLHKSILVCSDICSKPGPV